MPNLGDVLDLSTKFRGFCFLLMVLAVTFFFLGIPTPRRDIGSAVPGFSANGYLTLRVSVGYVLVEVSQGRI